MNILFLTLMPIKSIDNRDIYCDLMREFIRLGHHLTIVSPLERRYGKPTSFVKGHEFDLLQVKTFNIQKTNNIEKGIGTIAIEYQYLIAIKKYLVGIKIDLVIYSTPPITFGKVIDFIKRKDAAKAYLLLKDIFPQNAVDIALIKKDGLIHRFFRKKEVKLYELSDYIGCMSPANVEYVLKNNKISSGKVELCPNSIEPRNYEFSEIEILRLKEKYNIPSESCVFIYGGNLGKPQGLDFLIKVLDSNRDKTDCFFVIVGSGTEKPILDIWFDENCPQNAVLLENLPKSDFDILMGICDVGLIFLDPRFSIPNYPSRLLSYMETRKPVLIASDKSTDVGQIAESNKYGFWCESGDLQSFNNYVEILSKNEKKRIEMGGNAYGFLLENYVVQKSAAIILKHFCEDT